MQACRWHVFGEAFNGIENRYTGKMLFIFAAIGFVMGLKYAHPLKRTPLVTMMLSACLWAFATLDVTNEFLLMVLLTYAIQLVFFGLGKIVKMRRATKK